MWNAFDTFLVGLGAVPSQAGQLAKQLVHLKSTSESDNLPSDPLLTTA